MPIRLDQCKGTRPANTMMRQALGSCITPRDAFCMRNLTTLGLLHRLDAINVIVIETLDEVNRMQAVPAIRLAPERELDGEGFGGVEG